MDLTQQMRPLPANANSDPKHDLETDEYFDDPDVQQAFTSDYAEGTDHYEGNTPAAHEPSPVTEPDYDSYERDRHIEDIPVTVEFILGSVKLTIDDIKNLAQNVILHIDSGATANVAITCSGKKLGHGEIVSVNGQLGIRVVSWGG